MLHLLAERFGVRIGRLDLVRHQTLKLLKLSRIEGGDRGVDIGLYGCEGGPQAAFFEKLDHGKQESCAMTEEIMSNDNTPGVGIGAYAGGAARSRPAAVLAMLRRKIALRAELEIETARIAETLPALSPAEHAELIALLASEEATMDADIAALQAEAERIAREEAAARHVKPLQVSLTRTSSRLLQIEIQRRLARGHCPDLSILAEQAIRRAYGGAP